MEHGHRDVIAGGLPFAYVPPAHVERERESLLIFLPHSLDYQRVRLPVADYLDGATALRREFSRIDVCIYGHDYDEGTQKRECEERGFNIVRGASPDDAGALVKLRATLERYEYVTTPMIGSHVLYAAYCGCKVSITRPIFCYEEEHFANDPYIRRFPYLARLYRDITSEEYIRNNYPWLVADHPGEANALVAWAVEQIGAKHVLDAGALKRALGWDALGRIRGPLMGAKRRMLRLVSK